MSTRERVLAILLMAVVLIGGGFLLVSNVYLKTLRDQDRLAESVEADIEAQQMKLAQIIRDKPRLERYRSLSLPQTPDLNQREYDKYIRKLLSSAGFSPESVTVKAEQIDTSTSPKLTPSKKEPIYTIFPFQVQATGKPASMVRFLEDFYDAPLLHRIKTFSIQKPLTATSQQSVNDLSLDLRVEALVVHKAPNRDKLMPVPSSRLIVLEVFTVLQGGPAGIAQVPWVVGPSGPLGPGRLEDGPADYELIASRNIFVSPPPPAPSAEPQRRDDVTPYIYLTNISKSGESYVANLYDRLTSRPARLRVARGFDSYLVLRDPNFRTLMQAVVLKIDERDIVFQLQINPVTPTGNGRRRRPAEEDAEVGLERVAEEEWEEIASLPGFRNVVRQSVFRADRAYWESLVRSKIVVERDGPNRTSYFAFSTGEVDLARVRIHAQDPESVYISLAWLYKVDRKLWDSLVKAGQIKQTEQGVSFTSSLSGSVQGEVINRDKKYSSTVDLLLDKKLFFMHMGQNLQEPLRDSDFEKFGLVAPPPVEVVTPIKAAAS